MLKAEDPIVEPDAEADIGVFEDGGRECGHACIAKKDGVQAFDNGKRNSGGRLGTCGGGAVIAPVGDRAGAVDEGKFELTGAFEVGAVHGDATLVIDELRNGGGGGKDSRAKRDSQHREACAAPKE